MEPEPETGDAPEPEMQTEPTPVDQRLSFEVALKSAEDYKNLEAKIAGEQDPGERDALRAQILAFEDNVKAAQDFVDGSETEGLAENVMGAMMTRMDEAEQRTADAEQRAEKAEKQLAELKAKHAWTDDTAPFGEGKCCKMTADYGCTSSFKIRRDLREAHGYGVKWDRLYVEWNEDSPRTNL